MTSAMELGKHSAGKLLQNFHNITSLETVFKEEEVRPRSLSQIMTDWGTMSMNMK